MLLDEKDATKLPTFVFRYAIGATSVGFIAFVVLGLLLNFGLLGQPYGQYFSIATTIVLFSGMGLIGVEGRFFRLRSYIICMGIFISLCVFLITDDPVISSTARVILQILFRG